MRAGLAAAVATRPLAWRSKAAIRACRARSGFLGRGRSWWLVAGPGRLVSQCAVVGARRPLAAMAPVCWSGGSRPERWSPASLAAWAAMKMAVGVFATVRSTRRCAATCLAGEVVGVVEADVGRFGRFGLHLWK
jgi:hypothetical protein